MIVWKDEKNEKEAGVGPFYKMLTCRNKIIVAFSDASSGCEEVLLSRIHGLGVWAPEVVLKPAGPARTLPLVFLKNRRIKITFLQITKRWLSRKRRLTHVIGPTICWTVFGQNVKYIAWLFRVPISYFDTIITIKQKQIFLLRQFLKLVRMVASDVPCACVVKLPVVQKGHRAEGAGSISVVNQDPFILTKRPLSGHRLTIAWDLNMQKRSSSNWNGLLSQTVPLFYSKACYFFQNGPLFVYFSFFKQISRLKYVDSTGFRTWIAGVEDKHADHLTTARVTLNFNALLMTLKWRLNESGTIPNWQFLWRQE